MTVYQSDIDKIVLKFHNYINTLDVAIIQSQIQQLESSMLESNFWEDRGLAVETQKNLEKNKKTLDRHTQIKSLIEELQIAGELNEEDLVDLTYKKASEYLEEIEKSLYLNQKYDDKNALITIHAGAGGLDAEDWAGMVMSMYQAFVKGQKWNSVIIDLSSGVEGGVKTATLKIEGQNAYGLLKEEFGVHRLVRLSPFNSAHTRETSFCLVEVMPAEVDRAIIEIKPEDLKWDFFMAGGHGGQSVNTTYSAVRVTHLPTKSVVTCQNERSQAQNKQMALKYLQVKLDLIAEAQNSQNKDDLRGDWQSASWSNQIRSYVLHPYKMVKDLRSNWSSVDIDNVLVRGDLLEMIWSVKRIKKN